MFLSFFVFLLLYDPPPPFPLLTHKKTKASKQNQNLHTSTYTVEFAYKQNWYTKILEIKKWLADPNPCFDTELNNLI